MATWQQILEHARDSYNLHTDEDDSFSLVWEYKGGRSQLISVRPYSAFDAEWIEYSSYCCPEDAIKPRKALKMNADFALGALALRDDHYVFVYRLRLDKLSKDDFELPLSIVASTADDIEDEYNDGDDAN